MREKKGNRLFNWTELAIVAGLAFAVFFLYSNFVSIYHEIFRNALRTAHELTFLRPLLDVMQVWALLIVVVFTSVVFARIAYRIIASLCKVNKQDVSYNSGSNARFLNIGYADFVSIKNKVVLRQ